MPCKTQLIQPEDVCGKIHVVHGHCVPIRLLVRQCQEALHYEAQADTPVYTSPRKTGPKVPETLGAFNCAELKLKTDKEKHIKEFGGQCGNFRRKPLVTLNSPSNCSTPLHSIDPIFGWFVQSRSGRRCILHMGFLTNKSPGSAPRVKSGHLLAYDI